MKWMIAALISAALIVGCQSPETPAANASQPPASTGTGPYMAGEADPKDVADEATELKRLISEEEAAKAAYEKNPKDEAAKKKFVDSSVALGLLYTNAVSVDRKEKYKLALGHLNQALELDPDNADAKSMRDTIVNIYKSMGRPVPGES